MTAEVTAADREIAQIAWEKAAIADVYHDPRNAGPEFGDEPRTPVDILADAFARHRIASTAALEAENARLLVEIALLKSQARSETNDEGLLACPKCQSADGPYLYWWQRGQAWIVICEQCKHEEGRESQEYLARNIWNEAARADLQSTETQP